MRRLVFFLYAFWKGRDLGFPKVCRRVLNHALSFPVTYVVFSLRASTAPI
jgi:hypothetical protein